MKVLVQGKRPKRYQWEGRYACVYCNSVFRLEERDAEYVKESNDSQFEGMSVRIVCPICEEERSLMQLEYTTIYADNRAKFDAMEPAS